MYNTRFNKEISGLFELLAIECLSDVRLQHYNLPSNWLFKIVYVLFSFRVIAIWVQRVLVFVVIFASKWIFAIFASKSNNQPSTTMAFWKYCAKKFAKRDHSCGETSHGSFTMISAHSALSSFVSKIRWLFYLSLPRPSSLRLFLVPKIKISSQNKNSVRGENRHEH